MDDCGFVASGFYLPTGLIHFVVRLLPASASPPPPTLPTPHTHPTLPFDVSSHSALRSSERMARKQQPRLYLSPAAHCRAYAFAGHFTTTSPAARRAGMRGGFTCHHRIARSSPVHDSALPPSLCGGQHLAASAAPPCTLVYFLTYTLLCSFLRLCTRAFSALLNNGSGVACCAAPLRMRATLLFPFLSCFHYQTYNFFLLVVLILFWWTLHITCILCIFIIILALWFMFVAFYLLYILVCRFGWLIVIWLLQFSVGYFVH